MIKMMKRRKKEEDDSSSNDDQSDDKLEEKEKQKKINKISKHVANSACFFTRSAPMITHRASYTLLRERTASKIW